MRKRIIAERLSAAGNSTELPTLTAKPDDLRVSEGLVISQCREGAFYTCRKCRTRIQGADENYKSGCVKRVTDVAQVGLSPIDPHLFIDDDIEYREYFCPGCGLLLQGDFSRPGDPDFRDICLGVGCNSRRASQTDG